MKNIFIPFLLFSAVLAAYAPMNIIDHPVSTNNPEAQEMFNQGLTYIYAFNHDLAFNNFKKASELDPSLAMSYWGMALALGQNINQDVTQENEIRAYQYSQKALELSYNATNHEQAYIKALVTRYTNDPKADLVALRYVYRDAMKKLKNEYQEDLDAATLYAESILDLDPWKYWTWDGKPKEGTEEAIDVLHSVLIRNPDHIGANHYYIHAWEESPWPENALLSAFRLTESLKDAGHLLHMPCHIFILCGYYAKAIETSKRAIEADRKYIRENGMEGEYPLHYLSHNIKIMARVYMLAENYEHAMRAANELIEFVSPSYKKMPHLSNAAIIPIEINLYFHRWKEILDMTAPPEVNALARSYSHFARALAFLKIGDYNGYMFERKLLETYKQKIPPNEEIANNPAVQMIALSEIILDSAIAKYNKDYSLYIENLKKAVTIQDHLYYDEPPGWYTPIRIELGYAYLDQNQFDEAEKVFKKGLSELQRNGRLLEGLAKSLRKQGKNWGAQWVEREAHSALNQSK